MDITIIDVAPRDGLQNEPETLPVATKIGLIERLQAAGVPRIELGSFVNPQQVPQMAGTGEVATDLLARSRQPQQGYTALIPNRRGYELARAAGMRHVRLVLAASEKLNAANFRRNVAASLADFAGIAEQVRADGRRFGVAIGASFGCPFEGRVSPARVRSLAGQLVELGANEIVLADTTGMAVPRQVRDLCTAILADIGGQARITVHFHNTRNTGYANAYAALEAGISNFDAALGGIGGCPFAPRAVGNIASEDLVHMLIGMGARTGIDLDALIAASAWLSAQMGRELPALVGKAEPVFR